MKITEQDAKLHKYISDPKNWRPPSISNICIHMGWKSKNAGVKALKRLEALGVKIKPNAHNTSTKSNT